MDTTSRRRIGIWDIEGDNFFNDIQNIWCMWVVDYETREKFGFGPDEIDNAVDFLQQFDILVGHNIIDFDAPVISKFYPEWKCPALFDTLVLSRMLDPDRFSHALKSYGKQLDNEKGDYGEQDEAWDKFSNEMYEYCLQDVMLNLDVYETLCNGAGFDAFNPPCYGGFDASCIKQ